MNRITLLAVSLLVPFAPGIVSPAQADVVIVRTAPPPPPPPPQRVIVVRRPPPPQRVVVVQEPAPAQRVVVVRQAPPPPPRQTAVVYDAPPPRPKQKKDPNGNRKFGLHAHLGGFLGDTAKMGGVSGALRIRPKSHFAIDIGAGIYGGTDFEGDRRKEIPITADLLFFVNPQHRMQFYLLVGGGGALATKKLPDGEVRDLGYAGGQAGAGFEWRIAKGFALNSDVRAFLRHRVDNDPRPEFTSGGRTSNTSFGALVTLGTTFYF